MKLATITLAALIGTVALTGTAIASSHGNKLIHTREFQGVVYTMSQSHMSLYDVHGDTDGVSNCYGDCAVTWPPALLKATARLGKSYTLIERTDGTMQIAFKGRPLYTYINDANTGDLTGDGIGGVWHMSRPWLW